MTGLRHNPYVGSFHHGVNDVASVERTSTEYADRLGSVIMSESKNNPLVGIFRHSPSSKLSPIKSLGLKGIIYSENVEKPANMLSQLQAN